MKKLLLLLILIFPFSIFHSTFSQEWFPVGAKWTYEWNWGIGPYYGNYPKYFEVVQDTVILGKNCKRIRSIGTQSFGSYRYEENGKVYYYQSSNQSSWYLMYDFTKQIGDTIFFPQFQIAECPSRNLVDYYIIVYNTSEIILGSDTLKIYRARPMNSCSVGFGEFGTFAIERVSGGEVSWYGYDDFSSWPSGLRCYQDSVIGFYKSPGFILDCDTTVSNVGLDNLLNPNSVNVFPNPSTGILNVQITNQVIQNSMFKIYTLDGKLIREIEIHNQNQSIDVSELKAGLYLYEIVIDGKFKRDKLIIE